MNRAEFQPLLFCFAAKYLDIFNIENQLYKGLPMFSASRQWMQENIAAPSLTDQFNDPVTIQPQPLIAKVLAIKIRNFFELLGVDDDPA